MSTQKKYNPENSITLFDNIAHRYDRTNLLLTGGLDTYWRKKLSQALDLSPKQYILDVATGTGAQALSLFHSEKNIKIHGIDPSSQMIEHARRKIKNKKLNHAIELSVGNAIKLDFPDQTFDRVSVSFGIRNMSDYKQALKEIYRVLKPGGKVGILDLTIPKWPLKPIYISYFRHVMPIVGKFFTKDFEAYQYLNQTVEKFPQRQDFSKELTLQGFNLSNWNSITAGIATIYTAQKK